MEDAARLKSNRASAMEMLTISMSGSNSFRAFALNASKEGPRSKATISMPDILFRAREGSEVARLSAGLYAGTPTRFKKPILFKL
jgi:hypothetical protein